MQQHLLWKIVCSNYQHPGRELAHKGSSILQQCNAAAGGAQLPAVGLGSTANQPVQQQGARPAATVAAKLLMPFALIAQVRAVMFMFISYLQVVWVARSSGHAPILWIVCYAHLPGSAKCNSCGVVRQQLCIVRCITCKLCSRYVASRLLRAASAHINSGKTLNSRRLVLSPGCSLANCVSTACPPACPKH
jgi:hypothetical protein